MREIEEYFKSAFEKFKTVNVSVGVAINVKETSCDIERADSVTLLDAKFSILEETETYARIIPKEGSNVLFAFADDRPEAYILSCSEVERVEVKIGTTEHILQADGHTIKKGNENLAKILEDFMQELQNVIVVQGTTPNIPAIEAIKTRMKQLLK